MNFSLLKQAAAPAENQPIQPPPGAEELARASHLAAAFAALEQTAAWSEIAAPMLRAQIAEVERQLLDKPALKKREWALLRHRRWVLQAVLRQFDPATYRAVLARHEQTVAAAQPSEKPVVTTPPTPETFNPFAP